MKVHYKNYLNRYAKNLRNASTYSEILLWNELKQKQILNVQFNRQRPIGNYIADFYCAKAKLIIELDGITHHSEEQYNLDMIRQAELENMGYKVLRFHDDEVMNDRQNVLRTIEIELEKRLG
ncbi:MAG: endonuclease domain-containing protein [Bacteroidetes bacterium]|nr:endonuclease domain-containing protein [Bacteroidota bacterium]